MAENRLSPANSDRELAALLNPVYWDDHTYGDGDAIPDRHDHMSFLGHYKSIRPLTWAFVTGRKAQGIAPGENLQELPDETVLLFRQEKLTLGQSVIFMDDEQEPLDVPRLPFALELGERGPIDSTRTLRFESEQMAGVDVSYKAITYWGIVTQGRRRKRTVNAFPADAFYKTEQGRARVNHDMQHSMPTFPIDIEVGKVYHTNHSDHDCRREDLSRITAMQIYRPGNFGGRRRRIFAPFGMPAADKLATHPVR